MENAVPVTQNALYSCFVLFLADLYSVEAFCCIQEVVFFKVKGQKNIFTQKFIEYKISIRILFSLKNDEKLHIWFSLFNFLSKTSDVIKK
jgi:hypothetical protein